MSLRARLAEVQLAVMLLTRLPAGQTFGAVPELVAARWAFPAVGALIGGLTWAGFAGAAALGAPPAIAALLALALLALLTGALHFDGLADYADGIGGGRDRAHALEIMRDSRIGSYGVLAMIVVAGLWAVSVAEAAPGPLDFIVAAVLSRAAMVALQEALPPARADGMGRRAAGRSRAARCVLAILALVALVLWPWPLLACGLVTALIGWQARRRIGGQTGDVLGAAQLVSETAIWVTLACL
ncbi:adenosylcobinamide-GDP ribazoletransferase [Marinovum sp.]|uniref:adenosylcobinamide-GDP ribazoletransferase n=1 Tax=Marinovum sp. TaxID=2024839 RepID=UPI002B267085|nr:adenosylcobinamide-GDP ribazoletransferase [Marinovum sp.]